ncbi:MAG: hypothetical protein P4L45_15975 [Ignavibacteriaceae bacterium]|nr:hypothetical protein [Ignavibacteriaceae bacterium]
MKLLAMLMIFPLFINPPQKIEIKKIIIRYVDFNIEKLVAVGCDSFEGRFEDEIKTIVIKDKKRLAKFEKYINELSKNDNDPSFPDVRLKMEIFENNGKIDTLCMDNVGISFNNVSMKDSKKFRSMIKGIISKSKKNNYR